ncbi:hypothetical protein FNAPI_3804 [Fusarium napiforme]|uniref:CBM-cenC domain-containing protein n=1 Tax=Fusarium napiforme TaxID=42672 RepID=A0A8H5JTL7_9HYPO|nr:hypothetical protein FNAPI_3804 [Fusarium napiforme]
MTAFIAALLLAGSEASPCKPRARTTDILTTIEITSSSAKATSTAEPILSTTNVSSDGYLIFTTDQSESETSTTSRDTTATIASTTVTSSSIAVASSIFESSVESTTATEDATTTAGSTILTVELSSDIIDSTAETSTISDATTKLAVLTTETSLARETSSEMTEISAEESTTTEDSATTALSTTSASELSSTVTVSSTGISTATEEATTTAIISTSEVSSTKEMTFDCTITTAMSTIEASSVVEFSSTIIDSSSEIITSSQEPTAIESVSTTEPIPTITEITTTSEATTTATTEAAGPPTITNLSFDDTLEPWTVTQPNLVSLSLDTNIKHDGRSSALMSFSPAGGSTTYITQTFSSPPQAGVGYPASAWVRPGDGCTLVVLGCSYGNAGLFAGRRNLVVAAMGTQPGTINQWQEISYTCTYTQAQIDQGGLALNIGFMCNAGSEAWIDSVNFSGP